VEVLAANPKRTGLIVTNLSNNRIFLGLGYPAIVGGGIALMSRTTWTMDDSTFTTGAIFAISDSTGNTGVAIQEFC